MSVKWDRRFLDLARYIAQWSKDRSTKVGAVIVGPDREIRSTGYNGFPPGVNDDVDERHARPAKYMFTEHGERNALFFLLNHGGAAKGCTMYVTSASCHDCARGIIRAGISRVVVPKVVANVNQPKGDWEASIAAAKVMFDEAGVKFDEVELSE